MAKRKQIDGNSLIAMVEAKTPQKEIMDHFGFKTSSQFKLAYVNALMANGKAPKIHSSRITPKTTADRRVAVNKRGTLTLPKALLESLGIQEGDAYTVKPRKGDLTLKKIEPQVENQVENQPAAKPKTTGKKKA